MEKCKIKPVMLHALFSIRETIEMSIILSRSQLLAIFIKSIKYVIFEGLMS